MPSKKKAAEKPAEKVECLHKGNLDIDDEQRKVYCSDCNEELDPFDLIVSALEDEESDEPEEEFF